MDFTLILKVGMVYFFFNLFFTLFPISIISEQKPKPTSVLHFFKVYWSELFLIIFVNIGIFIYTLGV